MNARKLTLLLLPITVAFVVGGMAGSLVGIDEFQLLPALMWGAIIGIIDYNFSIMKELNALGWIGRIVLILTSAIITATVGDHILFKDTIKEEIKKQTKDNDKVIILKQEYDQKTIEWKQAKKELSNHDTQINALNTEIVYEINNGGCYAKCNEKKLLKSNLDIQRPAKADNVEEAKLASKEAEASWKEEVKSLEIGHNIIKEIQVLYALIFKEFASMIIFILLSLMVICIETLPLLLKSGVTYDQANARDKERGTKKGFNSITGGF